MPLNIRVARFVEAPILIKLASPFAPEGLILDPLRHALREIVGSRQVSAQREGLSLFKELFFVIFIIIIPITLVSHLFLKIFVYGEHIWSDIISAFDALRSFAQFCSLESRRTSFNGETTTSAVIKGFNRGSYRNTEPHPFVVPSIIPLLFGRMGNKRSSMVRSKAGVVSEVRHARREIAEIINRVHYVP